MAIGGVNVGQELLNVPMGDMIRSIALAIADAQWALDKSSMVVAELMSGQRLLRDLESGELLDEKGQRTGTPTLIDSRVFFGFTYDANRNRVPARVSMLELGFVPTFYQFVDTIIEVRISITIQATTSATNSVEQRRGDVENRAAFTYQYSGNWWTGGGATNSVANGTTVTTSQVNAGYANRYSYSVESSSLLRTKLVPVPPPAVLEERIRQLMELEAQFRLDHPDAAAKNVHTLVKGTGPSRQPESQPPSAPRQGGAGT
jgi:hypothetical protein